MAKRILFGIIGALTALLFFVLAVMLTTNLVAFQITAVIELGLTVLAGFIFSKKFAKNETVKAFSLGACYGALGYLVLIFIGKTVVFSLLGSITG